MTRRRKSPDGLPFRLYFRKGKFKVSFGYKLPNGEWAFCLSTSVNNPEAIAEIRKEAIQQAEILNGDAVQAGSLDNLIRCYFAWQKAMQVNDARRKAQSTLDENLVESKNISKVFGKMSPESIKPKHIYAYLSLRADAGAPAKANKEVALLSAILEFGRTRGELEVNPCRGIKYNPTKPSQKYVNYSDLEYAIAEARCRGGSYLILSLCAFAAYLTVSRPVEVRTLTRQSIKNDGLEIGIAKGRSHQAKKRKLIEWSPTLKATIDEAIGLQRTSSIYIFGNSSGQVYSRSGWTTIWNRLMTYCEKKAEQQGVEFTRFSLADMRPSAVTDRKENGEVNIINATGHSDERMINQVYDRRTIKRSSSTR